MEETRQVVFYEGQEKFFKLEVGEFIVTKDGQVRRSPKAHLALKYKFHIDQNGKVYHAYNMKEPMPKEPYEPPKPLYLPDFDEMMRF